MKRLSFLLICTFWIINSNAQSSSPEIISTAGESFQGNSIQIDWTFGELAIIGIQNSSEQITQGFHQPKYVVTSVGKFPDHLGKIEIFPNPTADRIEIELHFDQVRNIKMYLFDAKGTLIWHKEHQEQQIKQSDRMNNLANGTYFLSFSIDGSPFSQTFRIQKIN